MAPLLGGTWVKQHVLSSNLPFNEPTCYHLQLDEGGFLCCSFVYFLFWIAAPPEVGLGRQCLCFSILRS